MRPRARALALAAAMFCATPPAGTPTAGAEEAGTYRIKARIHPIARFRIGSDQARFGELEFAGGLEMKAASPHFGALSGLRFTDGQAGFIAVTDTGFWLTGTVERDGARRPVGVASLEMTRIAGRDGLPFAGKWFADAEGIAASGDTVLVAFERAHRIVRYRRRGNGAPVWQGADHPPVPARELRRNRGFEGIAIGAPNGPLAGALIGISEYSLDAAGDIMAFVAPEEGEAFEFSVRRSGGFHVTDVDALPDGDLIVLERRFNVRDGIGMRLRRIDDADIGEGATVDGPTLLEADLRYQIDNMEGLAVTADPDGVPRLTIVSDDNHSLLQRSLLIEFRLVGPDVSPQPAAADG